MYRLAHNRNAEDRMLETLSELIVELANQEEKERLEQQQPRINPPSKESKKTDAQQAVKRIYARYKKTQEHLNKMRQEHLLKESMQNCDFKVANSKSKEIISRNPSKPIFQRTQDIINQKEFRVLNARLQREGELEDKVLATNRSDKRFNVSEFQEKNRRWEENHREFIANKKMELLAESFSKLQDKPVLGDQTNRILNRNKEFYERDVLDRFKDYDKKHGGHLAAKTKYFKELITPFKPKLGDRTKALASRSIKDLHKDEDVFQRIYKSPSTKCVKHQKLHYLELNKMRTPSKSRLAKTPRTDLHNVTFSTPRSIAKSSSRVRFSQTSKGSFTPILKKLDLKLTSKMDSPAAEQTHRVTFSPASHTGDHDKASTQRGERENLLKEVVFGNRQEVIHFIKQLILAERQS